VRRKKKPGMKALPRKEKSKSKLYRKRIGSSSARGDLGVFLWLRFNLSINVSRQITKELNPRDKTAADVEGDVSLILRFDDRTRGGEPEKEKEDETVQEKQRRQVSLSNLCFFYTETEALSRKRFKGKMKAHRMLQTKKKNKKLPE